VSKAALSRTLGRRDALAAESSYLRTVLPRAVVRELRDTGSGGATRAAAIVLSLGAVGSGYLRGSVRRPARPARAVRTGRPARVETEAAPTTRVPS